MIAEKVDNYIVQSSKERRFRQTGHILWVSNLENATELEIHLNELGHLPIVIDAQDAKYPVLSEPTAICTRLKDAGFIVLLTGCQCPEDIEKAEDEPNQLIDSLQNRNILF